MRLPPNRSQNYHGAKLLCDSQQVHRYWPNSLYASYFVVSSRQSLINVDLLYYLVFEAGTFKEVHNFKVLQMMAVKHVVDQTKLLV